MKYKDVKHIFVKIQSIFFNLEAVGQGRKSIPMQGFDITKQKIANLLHKMVKLSIDLITRKHLLRGGALAPQEGLMLFLPYQTTFVFLLEF